MNKAIILSIILLPVAIYSCQKDQAPSAGQQPVEMDYTITRSEGANPPDDGTTYTIVSYRSGTTTEPDNTSSQQPVGKYAYLTEQTQDILVPCNVGGSYPYGFVSRNNSNGQKLTAGTFRTAIVSPAYPMIFQEKLGSTRILFEKDEEIYASDPNAFEITVAGYQLFGIPRGLEMKDIRAQISFDVYQGATTEYEITDGELWNAGKYGWYHPLLGVTDITNDDSPQSPTRITSKERWDITAVPKEADDEDPTKVVPTHSTGPKHIFATDYGDEYTSALMLTFNLVMNNRSFPVSIPIMIDIEKSTLYRFKLLVKSTAVKVTYTPIRSILDWSQQGSYNDGSEFQNIGTPPKEISLGEWKLTGEDGKWVYGGGSSGTGGADEIIGN